jgi:hypothetical protein
MGMLSSWIAGRSGRQTRRILEPVSKQLGVDYDHSYLAPPTSDAEIVMNALRCGAELLTPFASADGWPVDDFGRGISKRLANDAAKCVAAALEHEEGRDALSIMTQAYGQAVAATWRAAASQDEYRDVADQLMQSAASSERLADLVASTWPVEGYEAPLNEVARAEANRAYEPDNPDARVDLHNYAQQVRATADALAVAMSARFEEFQEAILGPVVEVHVGYSLRLSISWNFVGKSWSNLLSPDPVSQYDVTQALIGQAARGDHSAVLGDAAFEDPAPRELAPDDPYSEWDDEEMDPAQMDRITRRALKESGRLP